jgi:hypothetical protein
VIMPTIWGTAKKVSTAPSIFGRWTSHPSSTGFILQYAGENKVRKIWFTGRPEEILPMTFPGLSNRSINISRDGNDLVYVTPRLSARLILVENLFK